MQNLLLLMMANIISLIILYLVWRLKTIYPKDKEKYFCFKTYTDSKEKIIF